MENSLRQRVESEYDIAYFDQKSRRCKDCTVTVIEQKDKPMDE